MKFHDIKRILNSLSERLDRFFNDKSETKTKIAKGIGRGFWVLFGILVFASFAAELGFFQVLGVILLIVIIISVFFWVLTHY